MAHKTLLMTRQSRAGRSKPRGPLFDAAAQLSSAGYLLSIHMTTAPGDAAAFAAKEGGNYDVVVAVGGDGTLNEVASGLMQLEKQPPLGYLAQGSTNDFAACLQIPGDPSPPPSRRSSAASPASWISAAGTPATSSMWPPSGPLPAAPTPRPRPPRTPWATWPISWRA